MNVGHGRAGGRFTGVSTVRAAIYVRQSEDVAEGIERGLAGARRMVERRGWELVGEYVDNYTSASKERGPGTDWARMLADIAAGKIDAVAGIDMDRLLRRVQDVLTLIAAGVVIATIDGDLDTTTADGERQAIDRANAAQFEVRRKSERQRRANAFRVSKGRPVPGRRLFGYEPDGVTPRETEAAVVRRLFAGVIAGESIRGMAERLNVEGVPFGTGNRKTSRTGEARVPVWRPGLVRQIVNNRRYAGEIVHRGEWQASDVVVPIVDAAMAAEARAILADEARRTTPGPKRRYLLSGIATCGVCGAPLKRLSGGRREGRKPGYMCAASTAHVWMRAEVVEALAVQSVAEIVAEEGGEYLSALETSEGMAALGERLEANERATLATARDRDEGLMSERAARVRLIELRGERAELETAIERERMARSGSSALLSLGASLFETGREPIREGLRVAEAVRERFEVLSLEQRREIVQTVAYVVLLPFRDGERRREDAERVRVASRLAIESVDADSVA